MGARKLTGPCREETRQEPGGRRAIREVDQEAATLRIPPHPPSELSGMVPMEERSARATKPEIPSLKAVENGPRITEMPPSSTRKRRSTLPSSGNDSAAADSMAFALREAGRLSSPRKAVAERAAKSLIAFASDAERARDVLGLLPSSESPPVEEVRGHCLELLRRGLDKVPPAGPKR